MVLPQDPSTVPGCSGVSAAAASGQTAYHQACYWDKQDCALALAKAAQAAGNHIYLSTRAKNGARAPAPRCAPPGRRGAQAAAPRTARRSLRLLCHLCGWIERIPGGTRQKDGREPGLMHCDIDIDTRVEIRVTAEHVARNMPVTGAAASAGKTGREMADQRKWKPLLKRLDALGVPKRTPKGKRLQGIALPPF